MTDYELMAYFNGRTLPEVLRRDRASARYAVKNAVQRNIANTLADPKDHRSRYRLVRIVEAIEIHISARVNQAF